MLLWIDTSSDLSTLSKLYRLTGEAYYRIQPDLGREATCGLIERYLLGCIREDVVENDDIQSRYEAAQSLHGWFCHLFETADATPILTEVALAVTNLFMTSAEEVRNAIETGFLEHVLETGAPAIF